MFHVYTKDIKRQDPYFITHYSVHSNNMKSISEITIWAIQQNSYANTYYLFKKKRIACQIKLCDLSGNKEKMPFFYLCVLNWWIDMFDVTKFSFLLLSVFMLSHNITFIILFRSAHFLITQHEFCHFQLSSPKKKCYRVELFMFCQDVFKSSFLFRILFFFPWKLPSSVSRDRLAFPSFSIAASTNELTRSISTISLSFLSFSNVSLCFLLCIYLYLFLKKELILFLSITYFYYFKCYS